MANIYYNQNKIERRNQTLENMINFKKIKQIKKENKL